jgi:CDP-diacylglycerol---glycerol-3-phosphate 3-phosphatidyltransferase
VNKPAKNTLSSEQNQPTCGPVMRHLPNALTVLRILLAPVLFWMILGADSYGDYILLYYLFIIAGMTDVYDGQLARSHGIITTFGKFVDPVADKLLLAATLIPFYMLSSKMPMFQMVTFEVLVILLGREILITLLRYYSMWTGKVFSASRLAKFKTVFQMFFIGSLLVHMAHSKLIAEHPERAFAWFDPIHYKLNWVVIVVVVGLSVASAVEYIARNVPLLVKQSR